jgi:hypothetical protein
MGFLFCAIFHFIDTRSWRMWRKALAFAGPLPLLFGITAGDGVSVYLTKRKRGMLDGAAYRFRDRSH